MRWEVQPPQHVLFQLANVFLFLSYCTTNILALRLSLAGACLMFTLWGWVVLQVSVDTVIWNAGFVLVNLIQAGRILRDMFPVKFDRDREEIYQRFFAPGKYFLQRAVFKQLVNDAQEQDGGDQQQQQQSQDGPTVTVVPNTVSAFPLPNSLCFIRHYPQGSAIFDVGSPAGRTLSILLSGRCLVERLRFGYDLDDVSKLSEEEARQCWRPLNVIEKMEFLDSPEWAARSNTPTLNGADVDGNTSTTEHAASQQQQQPSQPPQFVVRIRVLSKDGCRVFHWNAEKLESFFRSQPGVEGCLNGVVGVDLARKIFSGNIQLAERFGEITDAEHGGQREMSTTMRADLAAAFGTKPKIGSNGEELYEQDSRGESDHDHSAQENWAHLSIPGVSPLVKPATAPTVAAGDGVEMTLLPASSGGAGPATTDSSAVDSSASPIATSSFLPQPTRGELHHLLGVAMAGAAAASSSSTHQHQHVHHTPSCPLANIPCNCGAESSAAAAAANKSRKLTAHRSFTRSAAPSSSSSPKFAPAPIATAAAAAAAVPSQILSSITAAPSPASSTSQSDGESDAIAAPPTSPHDVTFHTDQNDEDEAKQ